MDRLTQIQQQLRTVFEQIEQYRMNDVPILNKRLHVSTAGFREWESAYLGILITPWFMNLMLIAQQPQSWHHLAIGDKTLHDFPAGQYEFITGREDLIGTYQACSLFSPMFEFEDQAQAEQTACAVMQTLMSAPSVSTDQKQEQELSLTASLSPDVVEKSGKSDEEAKMRSLETVLNRRMQTPIGRRDFLRGRFQSSR